MCLVLLDQELHLAPIGKNPQTVLDVGTGTGIWAIEFGMYQDLYENLVLQLMRR